MRMRLPFAESSLSPRKLTRDAQHLVAFFRVHTFATLAPLSTKRGAHAFQDNLMPLPAPLALSAVLQSSGRNLLLVHCRLL
ncbi:hypothetical protein PC111_g11328 [Phytophthora cactorum]|nr:hypothetical protein PC111_g11328 [Phytophthora cactorum]